MSNGASAGEMASDHAEPRRRPNWPLALVAVFMLPVGVQAALFPRSFFEDFPAGRGWVVATGGAYNEHLVRDVGVLFLALVLATVWTAWTRVGDRAVAAAWIVQGVVHLGFHAAHLDHLSGGDQAGLLASLAVVVVAASMATVYRTTPRLGARTTAGRGNPRRNLGRGVRAADNERTSDTVRR